jgi:Polyketide cyclase / dehydrase and lipid transport
MKAVQQADQKDHEDDQTTWSVKIGPSARQWEAEITEQVPDERIVWKATDGANNWGVVTFHSLDDNLTRVMVQMEYHPNGFIEKTGNLLRIQRRRVRRELRLFKHFLEIPGQETGGWRGEIHKDEDEQPKAGKEQEEEQKKQLQTAKDEKKAKEDEDDSEPDDDAKSSSNGERSKKKGSSESSDSDDEEEWVPIQERGKEERETEKASS